MEGSGQVDDSNAAGATTRLPDRLPGLDALRGLAVMLVLLNHANGLFAAAGVLGVTVFFTLSGYLITDVLVRDLRRRGRIDFRHFYRNRALRLFPPLVFMLGGFVVVEGVFNHMGDRSLVPRSLLVALTYTMNVPGIEHGSDSLYHFWTLATEEQFYLIWPLVLALAWRRAHLRGVITAAVVGTLALCAVTAVLVAPDIARIYALPTSWASTILIGAAAYLGRAEIARRLPSSGTARRSLMVVILAVFIGVAFVRGFAQLAVSYLVGAPLVAVATVVLISYASRWTQLPVRWLRPFVMLGTVSYAAYLWNAAIARWLGFLPDDPLGSGLVVALTLVAASASWWLVERPTMRLKARLDANLRSRQQRNELSMMTGTPLGRVPSADR